MGLTQEQRAARLGYLGGTDAAAVMGLSRYKTPIGLWSEKTGAVVPNDRSQDLPILVGEMLEDVVARLYTIKTGEKLHRVNEVQRHKKYSFLCAQIDRRIVGSDRIFEAKSASAYKVDEWADQDVPSEYILQGLHQLMVTEADACVIACLIGGNVDFVFKTIERDEDMIRELEEREVEFWNKYVLEKKMPAVTAYDAGTLAALFPQREEEGEPITFPEDIESVIDRIREIGTEKGGILGQLIEEQETLKNELRARLQDSNAGVIGKWKVTWKNQETTRLDGKLLAAEDPKTWAKYTKTTPSRVLRISSTEKKSKAAK